mmetsp:Transcript_4253/g.12631  ORF Transcript_4253/g.12631 Transcript_4253/m.12631 type:complete len:172 (-) Transcript_4253:260-775(-)
MGEKMTMRVGDRKWIWTETLFLEGVLPLGFPGAAKDEEGIVEQITREISRVKGIPVAKQHVVLQSVEERRTEVNPLGGQGEAAGTGVYDEEAIDGIYVSIWIQWLPEVMKREKLKARGKLQELASVDRNFLITAAVASQALGADGQRWGTRRGPEPPGEADSGAYKAIAPR